MAEGKEQLEESLRKVTDTNSAELERRDQELAAAKVRENIATVSA